MPRLVGAPLPVGAPPPIVTPLPIAPMLRAVSLLVAVLPLAPPLVGLCYGFCLGPLAPLRPSCDYSCYCSWALGCLLLCSFLFAPVLRALSCQVAVLPLAWGFPVALSSLWALVCPLCDVPWLSCCLSLRRSSSLTCYVRRLSRLLCCLLLCCSWGSAVSYASGSVDTVPHK